MPANPRSQVTIGNLMFVVGVTAVLMAVALRPGVAPILNVVVIPSTIGSLGLYLIWRRLLELFYGPRCPACQVRGMVRCAVVSFGERFFLCHHCGARRRRSLLTFYGTFIWRDASNPRFDIFYQKPHDEDPWNAPPSLADEDEIGLFSKTHTTLVRSKRQRRPENPNGPGLE